MGYRHFPIYWSTGYSDPLYGPKNANVSCSSTFLCAVLAPDAFLLQPVFLRPAHPPARLPLCVVRCGCLVCPAATGLAGFCDLEQEQLLACKAPRGTQHVSVNISWCRGPDLRPNAVPALKVQKGAAGLPHYLPRLAGQPHHPGTHLRVPSPLECRHCCWSRCFISGLDLRLGSSGVFSNTALSCITRGSAAMLPGREDATECCCIVNLCRTTRSWPTGASGGCESPHFLLSHLCAFSCGNVSKLLHIDVLDL